MQPGVTLDPPNSRAGPATLARHARRLRILHVVESFGGGVYEVLRLVTGDSVDRGHRVAVAYGIRFETPSDLHRRLHAELELIPTAWSRRCLSANLRARKDLRRVVSDWKPDVVHLHSSFAGVVGASTVPRRVPTIYTPHGYSFEMRNQGASHRLLFRMLEAYVSRRVTLVAAVSHDEARLATKIVRAPRVTVIENGISELDRRVPERTHSRVPPLTVAMGRISAQRQPAACARILAAVQSITETRWIGGGAPDLPDVQTLKAAQIPITGWSSRDDALQQLADADVYLHWTAWDGQPLSVLEAIARDALVIAHDIPALREILDPRQLCRTEDEVVELICEVLQDRGLMSELLSLQRERAPRYRAGRMLAQWEELYEKVAADALSDRQASCSSSQAR